MTSAATSSMSSALSLPNGRGMSSNERAVSPFTVTSKQPLRGFSSLTTTLAPGKPALTSASSLVALVLNAPQDLQASILTKASPLAAFLGGAAFFAAAGFFAIVFVGGIYVCRCRVWGVGGCRSEAQARVKAGCEGSACGFRCGVRGGGRTTARGSDVYITLGTYQCSLPDSSRPVGGLAHARREIADARFILTRSQE